MGALAGSAAVGTGVSALLKALDVADGGGGGGDTDIGSAAGEKFITGIATAGEGFSGRAAEGGCWVRGLLGREGDGETIASAA